MILVDSNVLIDIIEDDPKWADWSDTALDSAQASGPVRIDTVVTAEIAPKFASLADFRDHMDALVIGIEAIPDEGAYLAGLAFRAYRERRRKDGGASAVLPDFLIGGHAMAVGATVLTRDPRFYRTYFPDLPLITPETHP